MRSQSCAIFFIPAIGENHQVIPGVPANVTAIFASDSKSDIAEFRSRFSALTIKFSAIDERIKSSIVSLALTLSSQSNLQQCVHWMKLSSEKRKTEDPHLWQ